MGLKKGQMPESFKNGCLKGKGFDSRTPEEMKEIVQKSIETRRKNREERRALQKCMKELLYLQGEVSSRKKKILKSVGFDEDFKVDNGTLLMISLFRRGLAGDTFAIKEIIEMMDKLDMLEDMKGTQQDSSVINININSVQTKTSENIDMEKEEEQIRRAESGMSLFEESWE